MCPSNKTRSYISERHGTDTNEQTLQVNVTGKWHVTFRVICRSNFTITGCLVKCYLFTCYIQSVCVHAYVIQNNSTGLNEASQCKDLIDHCEKNLRHPYS